MKSRTVTSGETRQRIPTSASPPRTEKVFFGLALSPRVLWSSLFLLTLLAYFPALKAGFIWDDDGHITRPELRSIDGLVRIWFELGATQQYYPVLHSAFWLEHQLWGDAPFGYHLINVLLHATAASLFGALLSRLKIPGAWFAAFLFALHPVAVESVAWISEQKNTLSTVFYLCAALAYLRFNEGRTTQRYVAATLFFVAALLSKTVTATLPAALLVILWWRDGSLSWRKHVLPLTPWLLMGIAAGFMTASFERSEIGAQGADFALTLTQRVLLAGRIAWFYFGKLAWPHPLIFIYPRWSIDAAAVWQYFFPVAAAAVFIGLAFRKNARGIFAAVLFFIGSLMPALGFFNVYPFIFSFVADHFQYLASLGLFALAGAAVSLLLDRWSGWSSRVVLASLLVAYGVLTWSQTKNYRAALTLYQSILDKNTTAWMAHQNLATSLVEAGRGTEAISHFEEALRLRPGYLEAENSFGDLLTRLGRLQDAMLHLDRAIALQPKFAEAHNNRGVALMSMGRAAEGTDEFKYALRLKPSYALAHFNLGLALMSDAHAVDAVLHFEKAVQLQPDYADAELDWGVALTLTGKLNEAKPHFDRAIALNANSPVIRNTVGRAFASAGRFEEAIAYYESALQQNADYADAHLNLAVALRQLGRMREATFHYTEAQRLGAPGARSR